MPIPTPSELENPLSLSIEVLDDPAADPMLVRRMLRDIAQSNRWFGGRQAMRWGLAQLFDDQDRGHTFVLCDIGTGAGDLPADAMRWSASRGFTLRPIGLERIPAAAALAREAGLPMIIGCASALPLAPRSVDVVLMSQLAHHLSRPDATALFAACSRIARRGVVVADLRPSTAYAVAFRVGATALGMHRMTRIDGITSIARGFTVPALRALVRDAGFPDAKVAARPLGRITAAWRTDQ